MSRRAELALRPPARGNLAAGQAAATLTSVAALAANPEEAARNAATAVEAGRTAFSAANLARSVVNAVSSEIKQIPMPWFF